MTTAQTCESCGMPIETGRYCGYCTDDSGQLQSFDERLERMVAWQARRDPQMGARSLCRDPPGPVPAWRRFSCWCAASGNRAESA
jgi:hypothetical protein